jgi:hypothetical protein
MSESRLIVKVALMPEKLLWFHTHDKPTEREDEVVEDAFGRQRDVHDLGEVHLEDGQEEFHGRAAHVEVFHRRDADDGGVWAKRFSIRAKCFHGSANLAKQTHLGAQSSKG